MELRQPSSLAEAEVDGGLPLAGGTEVVPLLRDGLVEAETLVDIRAVVPKGVQGTTIGAGTSLAELEADPEIPAALREACRLAASPQLRSMGTIGGNLLQATRCWYWRLKYPCFLHGGSILPRPRRRAPRARDLRQRALRVGPSVRPGRGPACARRDAAHRPARASDRRALPPADRRRPRRDGARARRADPQARGAAPGSERLPEGDGPQALGVPARRRGRGPLRRRRPSRPGRRGPDSVGARVRGRPRARDAARPAPRTRSSSRDR